MYTADSTNPTRQKQFQTVYKSLTTFCECPLCQPLILAWSLIVVLVAVIAIVLLLATFTFAIIVMRNFGRGLKTTSAFESQQLIYSLTLFTRSDKKQE
jgi:flagellar biosynthesis protein FliP